MRDTGPISKNIDSNGDVEAANAQTGEARKQLGILKNQMAMGGLAVGARTTRLPDGTVIRTMVAAGISKVSISAPAAESEAGHPPPAEEFVPQLPEPPLPPHKAILAIGVGDIGALFLPLVPARYNATVISAPNDKRWYQILSKDNPTRWEGLPYLTEPVVLYVSASALAAVAEDGNVYMENQPEKWVMSYAKNGVVLPDAVTSAKDMETFFGAAAKSVALAIYPAVVVPTLIKLVGTKAVPGGVVGSLMKGDTPLTGYVQVQPTVKVYANLTGALNFIFTGADYNSWINGIQIISGGFPTGAANIDVSERFDFVVEFSTTSADYSGSPGSYNCDLLFGTTRSDFQAWGETAPFEYVNGQFQPGINSGSGAGTFTTASGDTLTIPCSASITMTFSS